MPTRNDIEYWFNEGKKAGATHFFVVQDKVKSVVSPVYVAVGENLDDKAREIEGAAPSFVLELYNLSMDMETQLNEHQGLNYT